MRRTFLNILIVFASLHINLMYGRESVTSAFSRIQEPSQNVQSGPVYIKKVLTEDAVFETPTYEFTSDFDSYNGFDNIKGLFIKGLDYDGHSTKVFCWYGVPKDLQAGEKAPAVVLVHGGGGTAFPDWVNQWTSRGYIAIAIAHEGQLPGPKDPWYPTWEYSGPRRAGFFKDADKEIQQQWFYHATADAILANSLLRSFPEVDSDNIGINGISWGGILTNVITGIDDRFKFSIPVYGCGYLYDSPKYSVDMNLNNKAEIQCYHNNWEPSLYVPLQKAPVFYVNGTNDKQFAMNIAMRTFKNIPGEKYLRIEPKMHHSAKSGYAPMEIYDFADYITKNKPSPIKVSIDKLDSNTVTASYTGNVQKTILYYTKDPKGWAKNDYEWIESTAHIVTDKSQITAELPDGAQYFFINVFGDDGSLYSSPMEERGNFLYPETERKLNSSTDFWVILEAKEAQEIDGRLSWDFKLDRPGDYNIQILRKGANDSPFPEVSVESGGVQLIEKPKNIFVIGAEGNQHAVSQFGKSIKYDTAGSQTLTLQSDSPVDKIRITPLFSKNLGFGTNKYYDQWLQMHNSPEKQAALTWFKEAKFGMFIHWGLYSQAGGIWKGERMEESSYPGPKVSEWLMSKFEIPRNEYAELAKTFNPDKSFAQNIAKLAKDSGMKYMVITSKHHDGFALFDSKSSEFDMVDATPYKADVVKELYDACLTEGIGFGVYYSHGNDWYDGADGNFANVKKVNDSLGILSHALGKNLWDPSPNTHAEYIEQKALPQVRELLELFPELKLIWFDGDGYVTEEQAFEFYKTVYEINPKVIVNRRVGFDFGDYLDAGDNKIPSATEKMTKYFETCGTTNNSWAYKSYDTDWKSTQELLYYLVDIASKGGNFLLNIGPDGDGHVPEQSAQGLLEIGEWLETNGDAIYGTTRWKIAREGNEDGLLGGTEHRAKKGFSRSFSADDFWFTAKENKVYTISFVNPNDQVEIKSLKLANGKVESVRLLGSSSEITREQNDDGLKVDLEGTNTVGNGYVLEITLTKS